MKKTFSPSLKAPQSSWIDRFLDMNPTLKGMVSLLYGNTQEVASPSLDWVKRKWEEELELNISDVDWSFAVELKHSSSVCDMEPNPISREIQLTISKKKTIAFASLLVRRLTLFNWIKAMAPSHKRWMEEVMAHLKLEHLRFTVQGNTKKCSKVWQPFISYFEKEFAPT